MGPPDHGATHVRFDVTDFSIETGTFINRYQYDGLHRRIARTDNAGTTHYYYNENWQVLTETDGGGNATAIYSPFFYPTDCKPAAIPLTDCKIALANASVCESSAALRKCFSSST